MISPLQEAAAVGQPWALRDLPPFPWITTKVLQLYSEEGEELDISRLNDLIRSDASISSEILRRANSAMFGLRSEVGSIERAITMLGLDRVQSLAMTVGLGSYVKVALRVAVLRRCWRHSLGCALLAEELAEACEVRPDQAYTAGLLHDVGRLALLVKYPESYADLLSVVMENGFCVPQGERDLFDIDHCEAGAWLAEEWAFPPSLVQAIGSHHQPSEAQYPSLPRLVGLACRMADCLGFAAFDPLVPENPQDVLMHLPRSVQLQPEDLEEMRLRVNEKVNALE